MEQHTKAEIKQVGFTTDHGAGERARIGLLVLESDQTMEWEFRTLTDFPGVSIEFMPELVGQGPRKHMIFNEPGGIRIEFIWPGL